MYLFATRVLESESLAATRDALLPDLLSGEMRLDQDEPLEIAR